MVTGIGTPHAAPYCDQRGKKRDPRKMVTI